jgi:hypothetical protein
MKTILKLFGILLLIIICFFAVWSIVLFFIPSLQSGIGLFETIKAFTQSLWQGIKNLVSGV